MKKSKKIEMIAKYITENKKLDFFVKADREHTTVLFYKFIIHKSLF